MSKLNFSVFTKPWKTMPMENLAQLVCDMGFDAIEFPLREGFQIQPSDGAAGLLKLCSVMKSFGLKVTSIAGNASGDVDESLFAGCGEAGIKIIRICDYVHRNISFFENLDILRRKYDAIIPWCEKYNVTLGVQMHCGDSITNAAETYILLKDYDPRRIAAVWDSGHSGLAGNTPQFAIDIVYDKLCMVNFKAAYRERVNPFEEIARWQEHWTTGKNGCGSWSEAAAHLKKRGYNGTVCLPAEYSDEENVETYAREDLAYIKRLFGC